jgi:hypothetical protein
VLSFVPVGAWQPHNMELPRLVKEADEEMKCILETAGLITLSVDAWSGINCRSIFAYTFLVNGHTFLYDVEDLSDISHTGPAIEGIVCSQRCSACCLL